MKVIKSWNPVRRELTISINPEDGSGFGSVVAKQDAIGSAGIQFAETVASCIADALNVELIEVEDDGSDEW